MSSKSSESHNQKRGFTSLIILLVLAIASTFGAGTWWLSTKLAKSRENENSIDVIDYSGQKLYGDLRVVQIKNMYPHHISLNYDDSEAGMFLTIIDTKETSSIKVSSGSTLYATNENGGDKLSSIVIRDGQDIYYFHPLAVQPKRRNDEVQYFLNRKNYTRQNPQVKLMHQHTTALSAKFKSLSSRKIDMWFEDHRGGLFEGHLSEGQVTTTNTYVGHVFFFTLHSDKSVEIARYTMREDQVLYSVEDFRFPANEKVLRLALNEDKYSRNYLNQTGIHWRSFFGHDGPRAPPILHMWPADNVGQTHLIKSPEGFWTCDGKASECHSKEAVEMELEVVSTKPRAFLIDRFLSDFEADEIVKLASPGMAESRVGDTSVGIQHSTTRTSKNSWLARNKNSVMESLSIRASDLLAVDEKLLHSEKNAELMQVVKYNNGQKYDSHHDWGVSSYPESRYITLLLYLTTPVSEHSGGETSFPKGANGLGFKVVPKKGSAVLFYNLLPDGNADDLALHAALPCVEGEKWLANFWVWDSKYK